MKPTLVMDRGIATKENLALIRGEHYPYHLLASIERTMHLKGDTRSWATLREELGTHQRSTITLRGATDTVHQVRLSSIPEAVHQEIYRLLEVRDPLARRRRELNVRV